MNKKYRVLLITYSLILFGLIMLFSSSSFVAYQSYKFNNNPYFFIIRQVIFVIIGIFCMILSMRIKLSFLKKISTPSMLVSILLLILVLIIGKNINGAKRWINLGFFTIHVSKLTELALILYTSNLIADLKNMSKTKIFLLFPLLIVYVFLIMIEPSFSAAILAFIYIFVIFILSDIDKRIILFPSIAIGSFIGLLMLKYNHTTTRLFSFFSSQPSYQSLASLTAIANGGFFGEGLGLGKWKLLYVPEAYTDFIFSIIGEELGIIGASIIVLMFLWLFFEGMYIARQAKTIFLKIMAFSITIIIFMRAIIHIAISINLLPTTGLGLPFISYGGTAIIMNMILIGLLINIWENAKSYV